MRDPGFGYPIFFAGLLLVSSPSSALDPSFRLVMHDSRMDLYSPVGQACGGEGSPDVMFIAENRSMERLEMSLDLLSGSTSAKVRVALEPGGSTSVLSLGAEMDPCAVKLVGMRIRPLVASVAVAKSE